MAYQKQQWLANQTIISADRMNHIEDGIANIELTPGADGITPQLRLGDSGIEVSYDNGQQWQLLVPLSQFQLIRRYVTKEGVGIKLNKLGSNEWEKTRRKVSEKV